jgi:hypothetical protein
MIRGPEEVADDMMSEKHPHGDLTDHHIYHLGYSVSMERGNLGRPN